MAQSAPVSREVMNIQMYVGNLNSNTCYAGYHTSKFHSQLQLNDHSLHSLTDTLDMTEFYHHSGNNT